MSKYYAVKYSPLDERYDRIFETWEEAKPYTEGGIHKSFYSKEEAEEYLSSMTREEVEKRKKTLKYFSSQNKKRTKGITQEKEDIAKKIGLAVERMIRNYLEGQEIASRGGNTW